MLINLSDIILPPVGIIDKTSEEYKVFLESVKERGVLEPVILAPRGDKYLLVTGLVRYHASLDAGRDYIPAEIKILSDIEIAEIQIIHCTQKVVTKPVDYAKALNRMLKKMSIEELAEKIGKPVEWIQEKMNEQ